MPLLTGGVPVLTPRAHRPCFFLSLLCLRPLSCTSTSFTLVHLTGFIPWHRCGNAGAPRARARASSRRAVFSAAVARAAASCRGSRGASSLASARARSEARRWDTRAARFGGGRATGVAGVPLSPIPSGGLTHLPTVGVGPVECPPWAPPFMFVMSCMPARRRLYISLLHHRTCLSRKAGS